MGGSDSALTQMVNSIVVEARRNLDSMSRGMMNDSLTSLSDMTASIGNHLKLISDYNRELYKYNLRVNITDGMSEKEAQLSTIKKQFAKKCPGEPFYPELVEEMIREDYSPHSQKMREAVLKKLAVEEKSKKKAAEEKQDFKKEIIEALNVLGSAGLSLSEISAKIGTNHDILNNKRLGILGVLKKVLLQLFGHDTDKVFYELEYKNPQGGIHRERLDYSTFMTQVARKTNILQNISVNGRAAARLPTLEENQLVDLYTRSAKDILLMHKVLTALDEYFKKNIDPRDRARIRGIKPELSALKSISIRANDKFIEYKSMKEEAEQFKRMGIDVTKVEP
jgi:hypothetical protein